jgi:uncharacterized protein (DUF697 family)
MKRHKKEQNPMPKRPRTRNGDTATGTPLAIAEMASETSLVERSPARNERAGEGGTAPGKAVTPPFQAEPNLTLPGPAADPVPAIAGDVAALRPRAEQIVKDYVPLAVGAGMIPLPGLDLAAIGALQLKVLASLAKHYKVRFTQAQAQVIVTSLLGSIGTTVLAGAAFVSVAKIVPFFGAILGAASMPVAGGVITHAMGHLAIDHFEAGGMMETFDLDVAQKAFGEKIAAARTVLA